MSDHLMPVRRGPTLPGGADPDAVAVAVAVLGDRGSLGENLGRLTTYRVGGKAALLVRASSEEDLHAVAAAVRASGLPLLTVGRGSNLLVSDGGFGGVALILDPDAYSSVIVDDTSVTAAAALPLPALARRTADAGLTGLEWAVGVPGSVGGGVRMNAGGHGSEMAEHLRTARVANLGSAGDGSANLGSAGDWSGWDGSGGDRAVIGERGVAELDYGYRSSSLSSSDVVLTATFELSFGDPERSQETIRQIVRWRREHQPGGQNAGSIFTNPGGVSPHNSAGWLIEAAGLKGLREGTATVSMKHGNFIQADSDGSADDVAQLISRVRDRVADRFGVRLSTEVRMVGFPNDGPYKL